MRIGLNGTCLNDRPSGAKQRFVGLYRALAERNPESEFVIYQSRGCSLEAEFAGLANVSFRSTPIPAVGPRLSKLAASKAYWGSAFRRDRFDVFEGFHLPLTSNPEGSTFVTVHDIRSVSEGGVLAKSLARAFVSRSLLRADRVITVSHAMKAEIQREFRDVCPSVIHNGLDSQAFGQIGVDELTKFQRRHRLPSEYLLAVGHFERRKNYIRLIDALARLHERGLPCPLLIIGNDNGELRPLLAHVQRRALTDSVTILTGLSDREVRCAYLLCSLFVFPSEYEGFGIPILEAMAAGRPMVLSRLEVFQEITENSVLYFAHDDVEEMAAVIEKALTSGAERDRMTAYGATRVQCFTFSQLAGQMEALYAIDQP